MQIFRYICLLLLACVSTSPCWSAPSRQASVHNITFSGDDDSDYVRAVVRDKMGFLWLGTDNGVKRYDGYGFTRFKHDPNDPKSIGTHAINALLIDAQDVLWLAGRNLNRFNPLVETFNAYNISDNKAIWAIAEGGNELLWLGGEGFGLVGFNIVTNKVEHRFLLENVHGRNPGFIRALARDLTDPNKMWVASSAGLLSFNMQDYSVQYHDIPIDVGIDSIRDVLADSNQQLLWLGTREGIVVLNLETQNIDRYKYHFSDVNSLSSNDIWTLFQDSNGAIWLGTDKQGVNKYRPETNDFLRFESSTFNKLSFPLVNISDITEDARGSLWFTAGESGVRRITEGLEKFEIFKNDPTNSNSLAFDNVLDLLEDKKGYIWIATDGGGLDRFDPVTKSFKHYKHDPNNANSISSNSVISLTEADDGSIWVGTWAGGLNHLNPETGKFTHIVNNPSLPEGESLGNNNVFRLAFDQDGWLWISLWRKGLQRYNPETEEFQSYFPTGKGHETGVNNFSVNDLYFSEDENNKPIIWIAGHGELERFNVESKTFTKFELKGIETIYHIFMEGENVLWLATTSGLIRYQIDTKEEIRYTDEDGMADNLVVSIEKDLDGNFWLGTRLGLNRFNPKTAEIETYNKLDGVAGSQFNRFSHLHARSGVMYFGGSQGLTSFDPRNLPANNLSPNVVLTDFEVFQKIIKPGEMDLLPRQIRYMNKIVISYEQRDVTFRFSALDFIAPGKNLYKYRLLGLNDQWTIVSGNERRARYANLAPGNYTFQVLGSNNNGVWNEQGASIKLVVMPPWWMTWWARLIALAIFSAFVYGIIYWRLFSASQRKKELEILVKNKTKEIESGNRSIRLLNADLENRVDRRTEELSREVEERRIVEAKLFHMAFHDALTGLPNRPWLIQQLELIIEKSQKINGFNFGLMFLDGDEFKKINDTHGHMMGDKLLTEAARRLESVATKGHYIARLGGDEFTVLIDRKSDEVSLAKIATAIISAFNRPFFIDNNRIVFKVSIGIVLCDENYKTPEQILRDADISMYKAKAKGSGTYQMFDQYMRDQVVELISLENDLQWALERNEFELVYQPIVCLDTGKLKGFEALLRWYNPEKGYIPPAVFIPVAEESGLILSIGLWVLREACDQLGRWIEEYDLQDPPTMSVNLSALQLSQPDLIERIDGILHESKIDSHLLKLEITESSLMENTASVNKILDALCSRGIELAIDDFGTGYSSLSYLDTLPVQVLKIDRSFVDALTNKTGHSGAGEIVQATISLAHNLNLKVVAEGIETQDQYDILNGYGCDFGQGYLMSKPLSQSNAIAYIMQTPIDAEADKFIATSVNPDFHLPRQERKYRGK